MAFTDETLEKTGRGHPAWLRARRRTPFAASQRLPMPSRTDEEWRRTDVTGLDPATYARLEHANGHKQETQELPKGVIFEPLSVAAERHPRLVEPLLFSTVQPERDRFSAL